MTSDASFSRAFCTFLSSAAGLVEVGEHALVPAENRLQALVGLDRIRSLIFRLPRQSSLSASSSSLSSLRFRCWLAVSRMVGGGDLVGSVGIDEARQHVLQACFAGLDRCVGC